MFLYSEVEVKVVTRDSTGVEPNFHLQLPGMADALFMCLALGAVKFLGPVLSYPVTDLSQSALSDCSSTIIGPSYSCFNMIQLTAAGTADRLLKKVQSDLF